MAMRDYARPGEYYSADYLRYTGLDASTSFQSMFALERAVEKSASDEGVISLNTAFPGTFPQDVSPVYRVFSRVSTTYFKSFEFAANQTTKEIIPPVEEGRQIIVTYCAIRTDSVSGEAFFHNDDSSIVFGKLYISSKTDFAASNVHVPMGDGDGVYFTSTQGAKKIYVALNYHYEQLRIIE